jgi:hypothetical protein
VEPFGESPIVEPVEPSELQQFGARQLRLADVHQRQDPEGTDVRPDAAVVILVRVILTVALHVGAP